MQDILSSVYGGVWLEQCDVIAYLSLLKELWKQVPEQISQFAQDYEQNTVH